MATVQDGAKVHERLAAKGHGAANNHQHALSPWQPVKLLGEGTLARVYAARHESSRTDAGAAYAIKILRPKWYKHADVLEMLRRETLIGSRVRHPSVVTVLDARLSKPPYFLVMPRLTGCTLQDVLATHSTLPLVQALWIARQIAEGLDAIQVTCEMTHGDVKPTNVFLSGQGRVTLLDMGFARALPEAPGESSAAVSNPAALGSLAYSAPESLTSTQATDFRSDIYSVGVVLYQMLSGQLPHDANDPEALVEQICHERPACIRQLRPDLPQAVGSLVHCMLSKEPIRRPQSHAELIDDLVRLEIDSFADRCRRPGTHSTRLLAQSVTAAFPP